MSCSSLVALLCPYSHHAIIQSLLSTTSKYYLLFDVFFSIEYCPQVVTTYAFQSFREDVSVPWLVLHAHEPAESSLDSDLQTNPSHRVIGSTTGARNKSQPDAPQMSQDPGPSDLSSSSYDAVSPLHFHGLADTQTQTQVASSAEVTGQGGAMPESRVRIPLSINLLGVPTLCQPTTTDISSAVSGD